MYKHLLFIGIICAVQALIYLTSIDIGFIATLVFLLMLPIYICLLSSRVLSSSSLQAIMLSGSLIIFLSYLNYNIVIYMHEMEATREKTFEWGHIVAFYQLLHQLLPAIGFVLFWLVAISLRKFRQSAD